MINGIHLYSGKMVQSKKREGNFEVLTIDDYTESVWCKSKNSMKNEIIEITMSDLIEI